MKFKLVLILLILNISLISGLENITITTTHSDFDLDTYPYPFENDTFDEVRLQHSLEHVKDVKMTLMEVHRIGKNGSLVIIEVPHALSYQQLNSFGHRNHFTLVSMNQEFLDYFGLDYKFISSELIYICWWKKLIPYKVKKLFNGLFDEVRFKLEIVK